MTDLDLDKLKYGAVQTPQAFSDLIDEVERLRARNERLAVDRDERLARTGRRLEVRTAELAAAEARIAELEAEVDILKAQNDNLAVGANALEAEREAALATIEKVRALCEAYEILVKVDHKADATYIQLAKGNIDKTVEYSKDVNFDLDSEGYVLGVEILSALRVRD